MNKPTILTAPTSVETTSCKPKPSTAKHDNALSVVPEPEVETMGQLFDLTLSEGKLYDRTMQISKLRDAFHRRLSGTKSRELILITGRSGTGKSALAQTLRHSVTRKGGFFISGKFDQLRRPEPYAPFVAAFTEFSQIIVGKGHEKVASMKKTIDCEIDTEIGILTGMIPALEQILGSQGDTSSLHRSEAHNRFKFMFRKFVRCICSPDEPLVLLLDDLQWADASSLDLLKTVATDPKINGLVLVVTCRANEVQINHPLSAMLRSLEADEVIITNIHVSNLSDKAVNDVISDVLHLSTDDSKPLAEIICHHTDGNILFVLEFLKSLQEEGHLYLDDEGIRWVWDEDQIRVAVNIDIVQFVAHKMERLPKDVQDVLRVASCVGANFDELLLNKFLSTDVRPALRIAAQKALIISDWKCGKHMFAHDRVQQAAYSLIPESERAAFHLSVGRKLQQQLSEEEIDVFIYTLVSQVSRDVDLLQDQDEKYDIAGLCLRAGEKAMLSSSFATAATYFLVGIDLLGSRHWREQYDLSLALYNAAAEAEYCNAKFEDMDRLVEGVIENARIFHDKLRAYTIQVYSLGTRGRLQEALDTGFSVLRDLGEPFPSKVGKMYTVMEITKTKRMLRGKTDAAILSLPYAKDPDKIAAMSMMAILILYALFGRNQFTPLIVMRITQLTLRHGITTASALGFGTFGSMICGNLGDIDAGYRYGQLALSIVDKFQGKEWVPRVYAAVYGLINHWVKPLNSSLEPLRYGHRVGLETGDIEYAMMDSFLYAQIAFYSGRPLGLVEKEMHDFWERMEALKQRAVTTLFLPLLQQVLNLMGRSQNPLVLTGEALDEEAFLKKAREAKNTTAWKGVYFRKIWLAYLFHDYNLAGKMATNCHGYEKSVVGSFSACVYYFYEGLTAIALAHHSQLRKNKFVARQNLKRIKKYAKHAPENCLNKVLLMEAELAALAGKVDDAVAKYISSIAVAGQEGFVHEQALACERAGLALRRFGNESGAVPYLVRARSLYQEWGAHAKVDHMASMIPAE